MTSTGRAALSAPLRGSLSCTLATLAVLLAGCPGGSTTVGSQTLGGACAGQNSTCASGLCVSVDSATSICSEICKSDTDCPAGSFLCAAVPGKGNLCLPAGLDGRCKTDAQCSAGFLCDTTANVCYVPVPTPRDVCAPCTSNLQCSGICRQDNNGQGCTVPCSGSQPCGAGYTCTTLPGVTAQQCIPSNSDQQCGPDLGLCASCHTTADCGGVGSSCVQNLATNEMFCATACKVDSDCPMAFNCTDLSGVGSGPNACVPNSGTCVGYCDSTAPADVRRECGIAAGCDLTTFTCQPLMNGSICAACETDDDCVKDVPNASCLEDQCPNCPFNGQKFCSIACTAANAATVCGMGFTCGQVGTDSTSPFFCIPDSGSCTAGAGVLGDDCTTDGAAECLSGLCIGLGANSVCSTTCMKDSDCANGTYKCCALSPDGNSFDCSMAVPSSGGICAPAPGGTGADCSPGQPPCSSPDVCLDLGTAFVCEPTCPSGSGCATGYSCRQAQQLNGDGSTTQVQLCFPDGGGGLSADCTYGPAACQSGLCLKRDTGNICTQACSTTPCPTGYRCLSEALSTDTTKTTEVCVPIGS